MLDYKSVFGAFGTTKKVISLLLNFYLPQRSKAHKSENNSISESTSTCHNILENTTKIRENPFTFQITEKVI